RTSLAFVELMNDFDWPKAEADFREALRLHPGYATGHQWYAEFLASQGRMDEAIAEAERARELDPLSPVIGVSLAETLYFARRFDEAIERLRQAVEFDPDLMGAHSDLGRAYALLGRGEEAIAGFRRAAELSGID